MTAVSKGASQVRRATKPRLTGQTRRDILAHIVRRDGRHCHYCRRPFSPDLAGATLDHYIPHRLWRMNKPRNLVLACRPCNDTKADYLPFALAWLLLARADAGRVFTADRQAFTADPIVFTIAARIGAAALRGRARGTKGSDAWSVVFTLTVNPFMPGRPSDYRPVVGCRALVHPIGIGRPLAWPDNAPGGVVNTDPAAVNPPDPTGPVGHGPADPTAARRNAGSGVVNTDPAAVNAPVSRLNTSTGRWAVAA